MSYSSNSEVSAWYSFTRSSKSGSICFKYWTTSLCSTFESTSSESTLSENRSRMMPRVSDVSRCSRAGARTEPDLRLIFFHRPYRWSISRLQLCSVRSSATVRMIHPPAPVAVFFVVIGGLLVLLRLDQVGGVEKGALFRPDVDERGLYPRKHGLDRAEVDVAHHAAGVRTIHQELNKAVVLQDRDASLA